MKILFCCPCAVTRELGIGKHVLELAEAMRREGCECYIVSPEQVRAENPAPADYKTDLRQYLVRHAAEYDVVDYDYAHLPFARAEFAPRPLFVARSFILLHHFLTIAIPPRRQWKSRLRRTLYGWWFDRLRTRAQVREAQVALQEADLVNVLNDEDRRALVAAGISADKVCTIGLGLPKEDLGRLHQLPVEPPPQPMVVTVATFDARKGAVELPDILALLWKAVPGLCFRLLGGRRSKAEILGRFHPEMRSALEIVPEYGQADLPGWLAGCSVGIFPSYVEGFPLGVLEMLAAAVPVIAYDAPGAPMILPLAWLVRRGDHRAMADTAAKLLSHPTALMQARVKARERSARFTMEAVARQTKALYSEVLHGRQVNVQRRTGGSA